MSRLVPTLALVLGLVSCRDERQLRGDEIRELFAAKTVEGRHEVHGYTFRSYYEPTGTFRSYQNGAKTPRKARWWLVGDDICIRWEDEPEDLCRIIVTDDDGRYRKVKVLPDGRHKVVVTFSSFTPGNAGGL